MNNSLNTVLDAISDALRHDILPNLDDPFARSQAIAVIDVIGNLKPVIDWSVDVLAEAVAARREAIAKVAALLDGETATELQEMDTTAPSGSSLIAMRDALDERIAALIDRLHDTAEEDRAAEAIAVLKEHMVAELERERSLLRKPLFGEIGGPKA